MLFSHVFLQDQRLVGFPSLRVHLPVRRHAYLVRLPHFLSEVSVRKVHVECLLVPTGLKAFSIKCSGTSLYPTVSTKVRSLFSRRSSYSAFGPGWLAAWQFTLGFTDANWNFAGLQVLFSFCSITTRAVACTACERWENDTPWTWQSVSSLTLYDFTTASSC